MNERPAGGHNFVVGRVTLLACALYLTGCANPGPPRSPSLQIPRPVSDLQALRQGGTVDLHFTAPSVASDGQPLRTPSLAGVLCRELAHQGCYAVQGVHVALHSHGPIELHDVLPEPLVHGDARLLSYRIQLFGPSGASLGFSVPAWTVSGVTPQEVMNLKAEGSRLGVVLHWSPDTPVQGTPQVLLQRRDLSGSEKADHEKVLSQNPLWLEAHAVQNSTLDTAVVLSKTYQYVAVRQRIVSIEGHSIEVRSRPSSPAELTLQAVYPPPEPAGLTAAGMVGAQDTGAVDLIWQPVDGGGMLVPLVGYRVYRSDIKRDGAAGPESQLTRTPVALPAFHDETALPGHDYLYRVTAVDERDNESRAAEYRFLRSPQ